MSDSTNILNQVSATAIQRETTINENFAQTSSASLFAYDATASAALTWGYQGGRYGGTSFASGTVSLTASNTNYIVAHKTTLAVTVSTATTNWNDTTYGRCYKVVAGSSTVTSYEDHRAGSLGILGSSGAGTVTSVALTMPSGFSVAGSPVTGTGTLAVTGGPVESLIVACSDETTALTTGTAKVTWRMPYAFTLTAVRASLTTAQASGSIFTVDINEAGTSILSTKLTIDNTELTSTTAATPPVISDSALADDAQMTVDVDQIGTSGAAGLKIALIGHQ